MNNSKDYATMTNPFKPVDPVDAKHPDHYVNNAIFKEELVKYYHARKAAETTGTEEPPIPDYIGLCFLKIARGLGNKHNFRNYSYLKDMISEAVIVCLKNVRSYDVTRDTSAFSYFTQCIFFSFLATIKKEKNEEKTKRDLFFRGEYDTYAHAGADTEFQLSYTEFLQSLGTDSDAYESTASKKRVRFEKKVSPLDVLFGETYTEEDSE